jgi:hypothetical protein
MLMRRTFQQMLLVQAQLQAATAVAAHFDFAVRADLAARSTAAVSGGFSGHLRQGPPTLQQVLLQPLMWRGADAFGCSSSSSSSSSSGSGSGSSESAVVGDKIRHQLPQLPRWQQPASLPGVMAAKSAACMAPAVKRMQQQAIKKSIKVVFSFGNVRRGAFYSVDNWQWHTDLVVLNMTVMQSCLIFSPQSLPCRPITTFMILHVVAFLQPYSAPFVYVQRATTFSHHVCTAQPAPSLNRLCVHRTPHTRAIAATVLVQKDSETTCTCMSARHSLEGGEKIAAGARCYLKTVLAGFLCLPGTLNAARRETSCPKSCCERGLYDILLRHLPIACELRSHRTSQPVCTLLVCRDLFLIISDLCSGYRSEAITQISQAVPAFD